MTGPVFGVSSSRGGTRWSRAVHPGWGFKFSYRYCLSWIIVTRLKIEIVACLLMIKNLIDIEPPYSYCIAPIFLIFHHTHSYLMQVDHLHQQAQSIQVNTITGVYFGAMYLTTAIVPNNKTMQAKTTQQFYYGYTSNAALFSTSPTRLSLD
jgi:amino acid permease